jgi:Domain of unknown function (DUF4440)
MARRKLFVTALSTTVLALGCMSSASRVSDTSGDPAVRATEQRRFQAMTTVDLRALDTLLAEELTYTHTTGEVDTKSSLLDALRTGRLVYDSISPADARVRVYGSSAVVTGTARVQVRASGAVRRLSIRFTEVYVRRAGRWELVVWQSTRLPEP